MRPRPRISCRCCDTTSRSAAATASVGCYSPRSAAAFLPMRSCSAAATISVLLAKRRAAGQPSEKLSSHRFHACLVAGSPLCRGDKLWGQPPKRLPSHRFHAYPMAGSRRRRQVAPSRHAAQLFSPCNPAIIAAAASELLPCSLVATHCSRESAARRRWLLLPSAAVSSRVAAAASR
jgi:hypothetical protein